MSADLTPAQERMLEGYLRHTGAEFATQKPEDAIATMVADPYVALLPALSGGNGRDEVAEFYARHFIFSMPPDMELVAVSRTVGADHVIEESVLRFTHSVEIDWMLPGVAPTGRRVEIAVCSVVKMEGERVAHEHIYWDQASVLVQIGLLEAGELPVVGAEGARKILDRSVPVNGLLERARRRARPAAARGGEAR
ncbi:MAG TPA: nuclear transport factor 2 family protein [Myxococcota bacterium]|nr:nuclear transport factor 2 family protein [Myxococcota bacterium]